MFSSTANCSNCTIGLPLSIQRISSSLCPLHSATFLAVDAGEGKGDGFLFPSVSPLDGRPLDGCHPICMNQVCNPPDQVGLTSGLFPADVLRNELLTSCGHIVGQCSSLGISPNRIPKPRPVIKSVFSILTIAYVLKQLSHVRSVSPLLLWRILLFLGLLHLVKWQQDIPIKLYPGMAWCTLVGNKC